MNIKLNQQSLPQNDARIKHAWEAFEEICRVIYGTKF